MITRTLRVVLPNRRPPGTAEVARVMRDELEQVSGEIADSISDGLLSVMASHSKTGQMIKQNRVVVRAVTASRFEVEASVGQVAIWLDQGTGVYGRFRRPIRPKRARALRIPTGAGVIYRTRAAGVRPQRFFDRAMDRAEPRIALAIEKARLRMAERLQW